MEIQAKFSPILVDILNCEARKDLFRLSIRVQSGEKGNYSEYIDISVAVVYLHTNIHHLHLTFHIFATFYV